jgi:hypothetical protein
MKKLYTFGLIAGFATLNVFGQNGPGITLYPITVPGTIISNANVSKGSAFVIDNAGNKWVGFNRGI